MDGSVAMDIVDGRFICTGDRGWTVHLYWRLLMDNSFVLEIVDGRVTYPRDLAVKLIMRIPDLIEQSWTTLPRPP